MRVTAKTSALMADFMSALLTDANSENAILTKLSIEEKDAGLLGFAKVAQSHPD